jgi:hypothetical protein
MVNFPEASSCATRGAAERQARARIDARKAMAYSSQNFTRYWLVLWLTKHWLGNLIVYQSRHAGQAIS